MSSFTAPPGQVAVTTSTRCYGCDAPLGDHRLVALNERPRCPGSSHPHCPTERGECAALEPDCPKVLPGGQTAEAVIAAPRVGARAVVTRIAGCVFTPLADDGAGPCCWCGREASEHDRDDDEGGEG